MSRKRKAGEDQASPLQPPLSAFAAAKARQIGLRAKTGKESSSKSKQTASLETAASSEAWAEPGLDYDSEAGMSHDEGGESGSEIDAQDPTLDVQLSTWTPSNGEQPIQSKDNLLRRFEGAQQVRLAYGKTLAILGQYDLKVVSGVVTVYGAFLTPKSETARVIAPSTHALPILRCVSSDGAELQVLSIKHKNESLKCLEKVSPLFGGIWHCECGKYALDELGYTFTKIQRSTDHDLKRVVTALEIPYHWQQVLSHVYEKTQTCPRIIQVCGPFNSGKSTFSRILVNNLLRGSSPPKAQPRLVAFLDLDLDRPEISLPGHISLTLLSSLILAPPFAQPMGNAQLDRAHALGLNGYKGDTEHYLGAVRDLMTHFHHQVQMLGEGQSHKVSLIVHCPAWYQGSGNDLIAKLESILGATDMVCLAEPPSALANLQSMASRPQAYILPPRTESPVHPARIPAQLREMRLVSYFHLNSIHKQQYKPTPMSSWRPYTIPYGAKNRQFVGFFIFGEGCAMYPGALSTLLNGSIVSILVVEDDAELREREIVEGEGDGIPFFASTSQGYAKPIDPGCSKSIGLALVRSIDVEKKELLLLTPANVGEIEWQRTVLAFGGLETPGWAYVEDHHFRDFTDGSDDSEESRHVLTDKSSSWPWVESTDGGDDRGDARPGMQAWKTRRFRASK